MTTPAWQRTVDLHEVGEVLPEGSDTIVRVAVLDGDGKELWRSKRMTAGEVRIVVHEVPSGPKHLRNTNDLPLKRKKTPSSGQAASVGSGQAIFCRMPDYAG